jgi:sodium-coupled neutral amino acid transporter 7/8
MSPNRIEETEYKRRVTVTIIWFALTLALAVFIPNIGVVIQILGAFSAIFIFIFPGKCMLFLMSDNQDRVATTRIELGLG